MLSATTAKITADVADLPAGTHAVEVLVDGLGYATSSATHTVAATLTSLSAPSGSIAGGVSLVLTGSGFNQYDADANLVSVCHSPCAVTAATLTTVTCTTGPLVNADTDATYELAEAGNLVPFGSAFGGNNWADGNGPESAFDDDIATQFFPTQNAPDCHLGMDFGEGSKAVLSKFVLHPRLDPSDFGYSAAGTSAIKGSTLSGSNDGATYTAILTIDDEPAQVGPTPHPPPPPFPFRFIILLAKRASCFQATMSIHVIETIFPLLPQCSYPFTIFEYS